MESFHLCLLLRLYLLPPFSVLSEAVVVGLTLLGGDFLTLYSF